MVTGRQPCGTGLGTPWHPGFCRRLSHLALPCAHFSEKAGPGMGSGAEIPFPGLPSTSAQFQVRTWNAEGHPLWQWGHLRQQALALGPRPLSALESLLSFTSSFSRHGNMDALALLPPAKPVQTPLRAWMPRVSWYLWRIPHHCLGPFSL